MTSTGYAAVSHDAVDSEIVESMRKANMIINAENGAEKNYRWKKFTKHLGHAVDSKVVVGIMTILTIYSLFSDDFRVVYTQSAEADAVFEILSSITFFCFLIEVSALAIVRFGDYFMWPTTFKRLPNEKFGESLSRRLQIGSFYYWLDVIATLTLLMEMPWLVGDTFNTNSGGTAQQVGSAARVAARAGRIVRLMRMMRHIKFTKYLMTLQRWQTFIVESVMNCAASFKSKKTTADSKKSGKKSSGSGASSPKKKKSQDGDSGKESSIEMTNGKANADASAGATDLPEKMDDVEFFDVEEDEIGPESLVGATMTDLTNKRVIMLVLTMLIVIPLLSIDDPDYSNTLATSLIATTAYNVVKTASSSRTAPMIEGINAVIGLQAVPFLDENIRSEKSKEPIMSVVFTPPISYVSGGATLTYKGWSNPTLTNQFVRVAEKQEIVETRNGLSTVVTFSDRSRQLSMRRQSIYTTIFVICLLVFGTYYFTREVDRLVIDPIETMVALVTQISQNPLGVDYNKEYGEKDGFFNGMETTILLNTINKIGGLMRVGFGDAGASVIADNLKNSTGGRLNLMSGGHMINSIFGFCDIRQFTDTTECLQEEVMLFVNRIAHILHSIVCQCSGSANKNIGDAFLLTWKLEDDMSTDQMALLADQALLCFCRALIELSTYQEFICNFTVAANERLYKRFPGYLVRIGSGLHVGWAIEGAIGSNRKIDASYLSPHVNFTEFLESSTKVYGVPLLISESFYKLLSPLSAKYVRNVDRIRKPGEDPIGLYTYDSDLSLNWAELRSSVTKSNGAASNAVVPGTKAKRNKRMSMHNLSQAKEKEKDELKESAEAEAEAGAEKPGQKKEIAPDIKVAKYKGTVWEKDADLIRLRHMVYTNPEYRPMWDTGIAAYLAGDWPTAEHIFNDTLTLSGEKCGPSKFLLGVINAHGGIAPSEWPGYMDEK